MKIEKKKLKLVFWKDKQNGKTIAKLIQTKREGLNYKQKRRHHKSNTRNPKDPKRLLRTTNTNKLNSLDEMDQFLETYILLTMNHKEIQNVSRPRTTKMTEAVIKNLPTKKD